MNKYFQKKLTIKSMASFFAFLIFFVFAPDATGTGDNFFVDRQASSAGDGSEEKPFQKIKEALKEAGKGDEIILKKGEYEGGFAVKDGVSLRGESRSKVIVGGTVFLEGGSSVSNLTVSGGKISIKAQKDAKVLIENCDIKNFDKIGINIASGNGKLTVKNSKIHDGDGKGFYVEKGNRVEILSNKVFENKEEGIDLRDKIDGFVLKNQIYNNGESGIEVILGSADLSIKNNAILGNGSSGIATQYYTIASKPGGIKIEANEIKDSRKFGIDCNLPHGGNPGSGYWSKGLDVAKNDFEGNKMGRINSRCKLVEFDQGDGGDEYDEPGSAGEGETARERAERERKEEIIAQEMKRIEEEERRRIEQLEDELQRISQNYESASGKIQLTLDTIENQNKLWHWFWGVSESNLIAFEDSSGELAKSLLELEKLALEAEDDPVKSKIEEMKAKIEQENDLVSRKIQSQKNKFSLRGAFLGILKFFVV